MNPQFHLRLLGLIGAGAFASAVHLAAALPPEPLPQPPYSQPTMPDAPRPTRPAEGFPSVTDPVQLSRASERVIARGSILSGEAVRVSEVASRRANSSSVRSFADQVESTCSSLEQEINQIAANKNVTVPTGGSSDENERWQRKNAENFDADYLKRTVKICQDAIDLFEDYVKDSDTDPEIAAVAQKHLPGLREHLRQAESLQSGVE